MECVPCPLSLTGSFLPNKSDHEMMKLNLERSGLFNAITVGINEKDISCKMGKLVKFHTRWRLAYLSEIPIFGLVSYLPAASYTFVGPINHN